MSKLPAEVFHPGKHLGDELRARNLTTVDQIEREFGVFSELIFDIILGGADIHEPIASELGNMFGTSSEYWLNLQKRYDEWKAKQK